MSDKEIETELLRSNLLKGLTQEDIELFAPYFKTVVFQKDDIIIQETEVGSALYILRSGKLKVFLPEDISGTSQKRISEVLINTLQQGDCFGEYSLIDSKPTMAAVKAVDSGELLKLEKTDFLNMLNQNDRIGKIIYKNILHILIDRVRKSEKELDSIMVY